MSLADVRAAVEGETEAGGRMPCHSGWREHPWGPRKKPPLLREEPAVMGACVGTRAMKRKEVCLQMCGWVCTHAHMYDYRHQSGALYL